MPGCSRLFTSSLLAGVVLLVQALVISDVHSAAVEGLVADGAVPKRLESGLKFLEGPAADVGANQIHF